MIDPHYKQCKSGDHHFLVVVEGILPMMTERSIIAVVCSQTPAERERERPESRDQRERDQKSRYQRERVKVYNKKAKQSSYCANQSE